MVVGFWVCLVVDVFLIVMFLGKVIIGSVNMLKIYEIKVIVCDV